MQEEIIGSVLDGNDTLALLPTGGGKSICFQVPALLNEGLCIVISPLIALMKDQVYNLKNKGIPALAIHSGMSFNEVRKTLQAAAHGNYKFLYCSPERLETKLFAEFVGSLNITLIAVDEAHCISQWGYDFRPPYLRIANLRSALPKVPVIALTASATLPVQEDIVEKLHLKNPGIFRQSFEKANLSYSVFKEDSKMYKLTEILQNVKGSSIVYCKSRRLAKEVAELIRLQNMSVDFYHAGLSSEQKAAKQDSWINNQTRVIVCTNAFGMGIDKPDVRTVIHYDMPDCLESYYQEAGRAGRDEKKAYAVLLYNPEDIAMLQGLSDIRFPSIPQIKKVYQNLADYLQIPVGSGEGATFSFNLNEFSKNFQLDIRLVVNALKVLGQEGHLTFNESIFMPSQVIFTLPKELLTDYELMYPQLEHVIKCMLRTYGGIADNYVSINEKQIASLTTLGLDAVKEDLKQLHTLGVIDYLPKTETPQIFFLLNRASAEYVQINHENYLRRKQQYKLRLEQMLGYLTLEQECRSRYISTYFGDQSVKNCSICDICLHKKNQGFSEEEFKHIQEKIYRCIEGQNITVKALLLKLSGVKKDNFWAVFKYLQSENKLSVSNTGNIKLVNTI